MSTQCFCVVLRPCSSQKVSRDVHCVYYVHAVVPHLHQNCTEHDEGKATPLHQLIKIASLDFKLSKSMSMYDSVFKMASTCYMKMLQKHPPFFNTSTL